MNRTGMAKGWAVSLVLLLGTGATCSAEPITFTDGSFAGWSFSSLAPSPSTASASVDPTGGNPGACVMATTNTGPIAFAVAMNPNVSVSPATCGGILSVKMDIDVKSISGWGGAQNLELFLQQDAVTFGAPASSFSTGSSTAWHKVTTDAFTATSFKKVTGSNYLFWDGTVHPDFSASGNPIIFGFAAGNGFSGIYTQLYDNWSLTVNPVPEPSALAGLASMALFALGIAWRRRKQATQVGRPGEVPSGTA